MTADWVNVGIGIGSAIVASAVTGAIWYGALKSWMAVREERESAVRSDVDDHESRLRDLERGHRQPMDYAR